MRTNFVVAWYETGLQYGGPEEGGWWYNTGDLVRVFATAKTESKAYEIARRANRTIAHLQRGKRPVSSVAYAGGRHHAHVYPNTAPRHFPTQKPHYE